MKPHPEMTIEMILHDLIANIGDQLPKPASGRPSSTEERTAMHDQMIDAVRNGQVRFVCIGCLGDGPAVAMAMCACGGFICPDCRAVEEEGTCNHERALYLPHN